MELPHEQPVGVGATMGAYDPALDRDPWLGLLDQLARVQAAAATLVRSEDGRAG